VRWYHSQGRKDDALDVLRTVAKWNGRPFPEAVTLEKFRKEQPESTDKRGTYIDLFERKKVIKTLTFCLMW
jgi:hypothetical protein